MGRRKQSRPTANLGAVETRQPGGQQEESPLMEGLEESEEEEWPQERPAKRRRRAGLQAKQGGAAAAADVTVQLVEAPWAAEQLWALGNADLHLSRGSAGAAAGGLHGPAQTLQLWMQQRAERGGQGEGGSEAEEEEEAVEIDEGCTVTLAAEVAGPLGTAQVRALGAHGGSLLAALPAAEYKQRGQ